MPQQRVLRAQLLDLGSILVVGAHPDDETVIAGGILVAAAQIGQPVACLTATRGEAGVQDSERWPADQLAEIREKELEAALKALRVRRHRLLDYRDGVCAEVPLEEGAGKLLEYMNVLRPDTILTFGPEGLTGHPDHMAMSRWVDEAVRQSGRAIKILHYVNSEEQYAKGMKDLDRKVNFYFNIKKPPVVPDKAMALHFVLNRHQAVLKRTALAAMPSQMESLLDGLPQSEFTAALGVECFVEHQL